MKSLKITTLLLIPFIAEIAVSCVGCNCPDPDPKTYVNCNIQVEHLDYSYNNFPSISQADTLSKDEYGIYILMERKENICQTPATPLFSLFSSAYACSCIPGREFYPKAEVTAIQIFTVNDFDGTHPANSEVSEYFMVNEQGSLLSIADYISQIEADFYEDSGSLNDNAYHHTNLQLQTPPAPGTYHQFEVQVKLSDGQSITAQTKLVYLD